MRFSVPGSKCSLRFYGRSSHPFERTVHPTRIRISMVCCLHPIISIFGYPCGSVARIGTMKTIRMKLQNGGATDRKTINGVFSTGVGGCHMVVTFPTQSDQGCTDQFVVVALSFFLFGHIVKIIDTSLEYNTSSIRGLNDDGQPVKKNTSLSTGRPSAREWSWRPSRPAPTRPNRPRTSDRGSCGPAISKRPRCGCSPA